MPQAKYNLRLIINMKKDIFKFVIDFIKIFFKRLNKCSSKNNINKLCKKEAAAILVLLMQINDRKIRFMFKID